MPKASRAAGLRLDQLGAAGAGARRRARGKFLPQSVAMPKASVAWGPSYGSALPRINFSTSCV